MTVNDDAEAEFVAATVTDLFGDERYRWMAKPEPGAEDFSFVLEQVPGAFLFLGACPAGTDPATAPHNHAPTPCSTTPCWPTARRSTPSSRSSAWPVHDRGRVPRDGGSLIGNKIGLGR